MGVRVKLRLCIKEKCVLLNALVNSGYEAVEPELAIPLNIAKDLGLWPPEEMIIEEAVTAGGSIPVYVVNEKARVELIDEDEVLGTSECVLVINPYIEEPLISDQLIDSLGIIVISFSKGLWKHKNDPSDRVRISSR